MAAEIERLDDKPPPAQHQIEYIGPLKIAAPKRKDTRYEAATPQQTADFDKRFGPDQSPVKALPPFPIDDHINQQLQGLSPEDTAKQRKGADSVLERFGRSWQNYFYAGMQGVNRASAGFYDDLDAMARWMEARGLGERGKLFESWAKELDKNADYWKEQGEKNGIGVIEDFVGQAAGKAIPGMTDFILKLKSGLIIPALAGAQRASERHEDPFLHGTLEAVKTGTMGLFMRMVAPFSRYMQATALGTLFGAEAGVSAPEGQKLKETLKGAVEGVGFGMMSSPGGVRLKDIYPELGRRIPELEPRPAPAPPPKKEPGLRPAIKEGEQITVGEEGGTHPEIAVKATQPDETGAFPVIHPQERGFTDPDGKFLTREEAKSWVQQNEPEVYQKWAQMVFERSGVEKPDDFVSESQYSPESEAFHSEDYSLAKESVERAKREAQRPLPIENPGTFHPWVQPAGIRGKVAKIFKDMHDAVTIDILPKLSRYGLSNNGVQHASARVAVPKIVDDLLAKVFPDSYKNPQKMSQVIDVLNTDNILGGYDSFRQRAEEATDEKEKAKWSRAADKIAETHDLVDLNNQVLEARKSKPVMEAIRRWEENIVPRIDQLYNEMKNVDPLTERESRGRYFDARINLLSKDREGMWLDSSSDTAKELPTPSASSYRNPNVKPDAYDRMAHFTGQYSNDARAVLTAVIGPRWNEVTKLRFYKDLIDSGVGREAQEFDPDHPETVSETADYLRDQGYKRVPFKMPETNDKGVTHIKEKALWVPEELVREIRDVLGTDMRLEGNKVGRVLTEIQLTQLADLVTHTKNILSVVTRAQGSGSVWSDIVRKVPGLGSSDAVWRILKTTREVLSDTPEIRSEIAEMARRGLIRPKFPPTGVQKITRGQEILHEADTAARVIMNRFFDNLVERKLAVDSEANRRDFVEQIGNYNKRLQGPMMRMMSDSGLSPFIVAGRNFNRQGRWAVTGNPGLEAASTNAAFQMRVTNILGTAALFTVPALLNYLTTGKAEGRKGTAIGQWDLGQEIDENTGKHKVIDLLEWTGARRGLRSIGVDDIAKGLQTGENANQIAGNALQSAAQTILHPWIGPAPAFVSKALTGKQLDIRGRMEAQKLPEGGGLQMLENFRAALESQNPLVYSILRPIFQEMGLDQKADVLTYPKEVGTAFIKSPQTAVGLKDVTPPPTEVEQAKAEARVRKARVRMDIDLERGESRAARKKRFTALRRAQE